MFIDFLHPTINVHIFIMLEGWRRMVGAPSPPMLMAFSSSFSSSCRPLSSSSSLLPLPPPLSAIAQAKFLNFSESCVGCSLALFSQRPGVIRFPSLQSKNISKVRKKRYRCFLAASDSRDPGSNSSIPDVNSSIKATDDDNQLPKAKSISVTESNSVEEAKSASSNSQSLPRKSLTAREKLRAARVLSRYTESKPPKSVMGTSVLDALKESDKGKRRSRLPEAPSNLFDDSKRGLPKQGLTFNFPGGNDLLLIAVSFVLISSLMLGTTYIVWKAGAIHFNEY